MANQKLSVKDPEFVDKIIFEVKSSGHFDAFRKECLSDVDINPAYQNLHSRVEDSVQKFLNRQIYTPDTNKIRLREDMRNNVIRAGFLDIGVSRIVDQVVEQKMDFIQSKVEEILYNYLGIEKPIKEEKNGSLEINTELMNDLEQVSDKTSLDSLDVKEEVEEEVVEEDFESPAFEPIETGTKNENTQNSNLSEISGLTSQDSAENNSEKNEPMEEGGEQNKPETGLSQISTTTQDNIADITEPGTALIISGISGEEAQMAPSLNDSLENDGKLKEVNTAPIIEPQKSLFDLNKDVIEFTGTERKNISLDDSTNSGEIDKSLQPQDVQSSNMEVDNLYENETTDSSEMKMEIDLKDESTAETGTSSKIEETSSQESLKDKSRKDDDKKSHKSSSHKSSRHSHHQSSSSSKSKPEKSRSTHKSSSHKKSSSDKEKSSSSSRKDREKEKKSEPSKSRNDDHQQEKQAPKRRRSSDSHDGRDEKPKSSAESQIKDEKVEQQSANEKPVETKTTSENETKPKSSILLKYDYLKRPAKADNSINEEAFHGFTQDENKHPGNNNPWFDMMGQLLKDDKLPKIVKKTKAKVQKTSSESTSGESLSTSNSETHEHKTTTQNQRYDATELYKPKFDFRSRRRTQLNNEESTTVTTEAKETVPSSN